MTTPKSIFDEAFRFVLDSSGNFQGYLRSDQLLELGTQPGLLDREHLLPLPALKRDLIKIGAMSF
jgi:hypothetical protein